MLNATPDFQSRLSAFQQKSGHAPAILVPICQKVPDNPKLHDTIPSLNNRFPTGDIKHFEPEKSGTSLFAGALLYTPVLLNFS